MTHLTCNSSLYSWMKVFRIILEFWMLRPASHRNQNPEFRNNKLVLLSQICVHSEIRRTGTMQTFGLLLDFNLLVSRFLHFWVSTSYIYMCFFFHSPSIFLYLLQVFGKLVDIVDKKSPVAWDHLDADPDLKEHMVGILFSRSKLTYLQKQVHLQFMTEH